MICRLFTFKSISTNAPKKINKSITGRFVITSVFSLVVGLGFFSLVQAQTIPEDNLLPCDELEQKALEQVSPDEVKKITAYKPAEIKERKNPRYPESAIRGKREGWVKLSYVIDTQGNVQDPVVEDYAGDRSFKRAAMSAIKGWTFEPAIKNGEPTEQCHQEVIMSFALSGKGGASRRYAVKYREADEKLESGDVASADQLVQELAQGDYRNRYENVWTFSLDARVAKELGDEKRELASIRRLLSSSSFIGSKDAIFSPEYYAYMYQRMFSLELKQNLFAEAMQTVAEIRELENADAILAPLQPTIDEVQEFIASDENFFVVVDLDETGSYFHSLARNKFAFADIQGSLDTVEVRCDTHREKFTVAEEFVWDIPKSWGQCRVLVEGKQGTRFGLVEVNKV
ncbi:energy transducer TonB [Glaciecola siphonariae]|uniref:Energy transducer TonB n=1 Tax=Glaciecola siphonariae TaxID=521012 RepID=A0ABV9LYJ0_9ALTE